MQLNDFNEKIHSYKILQITAVACLYCFVISKAVFYVPSLMLVTMLFLWCGLEFKLIFKILCISVAFGFSFFILAIVFPSKMFEQTDMLQFAGLRISIDLLKIQSLIFLRIVCISSISIMSAYLINYEKIFIYLMNKKKMSAQTGYALILALNSIALMKSELSKINLNARFRGVVFYKRVNVLFSLLVFTIKHADRGAMSLITRGLTSEKLFYYDSSMRPIDKTVAYLFFLIHFLLLCLWLTSKC